MRDTMLEGALPIYAKLLTQQMGIKLNIGGDKAFARRGEITIPSLPTDHSKAKVTSYGYIMHESGHIDDTLFDVWPQEPVLARVTNWFEDIRIENQRMKRYPGARKRLNDLVSLLVEEQFFKAPTPQDSPAQLLSSMLLFRLRSDVLQQEALKDYADQAESLARKAIPESAVSRLNVMMYEVENCHSTQDCIDLAQAVLDMLKDEQEKQEDPPENHQGDSDPAPQQQDQGQASSGPSDPDSEDDSNDPQGSDPDSTQGSGASPDDSSDGAAAEEKGQSATGQEDGGQPDQGNNQMANNLKGILDGSDDAGVEDLGQMLETILHDMHVAHVDEAIEVPPAQKVSRETGVPGAILQRVDGSSRALKRRILNLLEGRDRDKLMTKRSGRRLDSKSLYRLETSDFRVFQKRIEGVAMNTAVMVLVDKSSSMGSCDRLRIAADAALALQVAFEGAKGLSSSVASFPEVVNGNSNGVAVVSEFGESTRKTAPRFAALSPTGFTPMAEAMVWAGVQLASRKEDRKILLVVTDGQPEASNTTTAVSRGKALQIRRELDRAGIETLALGIGIDVGWLFQKSQIISTIDDLPSAMFAMMQETLLRKAA